MRIELASKKAIEYACKHFHYAKRYAFSFTGYSVFNDAGEWCGVICFDRGAINTASPFGLKTGQAAELVRVALNAKQEFTSKAVAAAIRQFAKDCPLVQVLVSFADQEEGHVGTIYQATNWIYLGALKSHLRWRDPKDPPGVFVHDRGVTPTGFVKDFTTGKMVKCRKQSDLIQVRVKPKHKYAYPLNRASRKLLSAIAKPYPKKEPAEAA